MNRIFGYDTYDKISKFLPPASILKLGFNDLSLCYWLLTLKKLYSSKKAVNQYLRILKSLSKVLLIILKIKR